MRYAVIQNNEVVNIIKADEDFALKYAEETGNTLVCVENTKCDIGYKYINGEFLAE